MPKSGAGILFAPVLMLLIATTIAIQLICAGVARGTEFSDGMLPLVVDQVTEETALEPYLGYFVDRHGSLTLEDILSPNYQNRFIRLSDGLPPTTVGAMWLRLTLVSTGEKLPHALEVNLGPNLPQDRYQAYLPEAAEPHFLGRMAIRWKTLDLEGSPSFLLPEVESQPVTIYMRLEGVPHLWFAPVVNIDGAKTNNNANLQLFILGITALAAIIAFARGIFQNSNEKIWSGVYSVILLLQIYMPLVSTGKGIIPLTAAPFVLAPGLALLILPQLGRIRMGTENYAPRSDLILRMSTWLGAVLALLPLVPGLAWVARYLILWPVFCLPLFLVATLCLIVSLEGALGYFICAALSLAGAVVAVSFAGVELPPFWVSAAPLLGLALGALALALSTCPSANRRHPFKKTIPDPLNSGGSAPDRTDRGERAGLSVLESTDVNGKNGSYGKAAGALSLAVNDDNHDSFYANSSFDNFLNTPFPEVSQSGPNQSPIQSPVQSAEYPPIQLPEQPLGEAFEQIQERGPAPLFDPIPGQTYSQTSEGLFTRAPEADPGQMPDNAYGQPDSAAYQLRPTAQISEQMIVNLEHVRQDVPGTFQADTLHPGSRAEALPYTDPDMPDKGKSFLGLSLQGNIEDELLQPYTTGLNLHKEEPAVFSHPVETRLDSVNNAGENAAGDSPGTALENEFVVSRATHEFYQPVSEQQAPPYGISGTDKIDPETPIDRLMEMSEPRSDAQDLPVNVTPPSQLDFTASVESSEVKAEGTSGKEPVGFFGEPIYIEEPNPYQNGYGTQPPPETAYWREPEAAESPAIAKTFTEQPSASHRYDSYENALGEASPEAFSTADMATASAVSFVSRQTVAESLLQQDQAQASPPRPALNVNLTSETVYVPNASAISPADTTGEANQELPDPLLLQSQEEQSNRSSHNQEDEPSSRHLGLIAEEEPLLSDSMAVTPQAFPETIQMPPAMEASLRETSPQDNLPELMPLELSPTETSPTVPSLPEYLPGPVSPAALVSLELTPRPAGPDDEDLLLPKVLLPPKAVEAFSGPLSELLRNLAALSSCSLAPMAKVHAESAAKNGEALMAVAKRFGMAQPAEQSVRKEDKRPFDIYKMLNELHEENLPNAQQKSLGLSWFVSPRLSHRFEGDGARLKSILDDLLRDSIQASSKGNVQFSARLTADSTDPGMVTFTISDSRPFSSRYDPSANQASLEAIKFADAMGGTFSTSNNQNNGTVVSFSALFTPLPTGTQKSLPEEKPQAAKPVEPSFAQAVEQVINLKKPEKPVYYPTHISNNVLVLDMAFGTRRLLLNLLDQLGIKGREARFAPEAIDSYAQEPTRLVTVSADMPESDLASFVNELKKLEQQNNVGQVKILAIAGNEAQTQRLLSLGCNQVILKPLTLENVREAVEALAPKLLSQTATEQSRDFMPPSTESGTIPGTVAGIVPEQPSQEMNPEEAEYPDQTTQKYSPTPNDSPATTMGRGETGGIGETGETAQTNAAPDFAPAFSATTLQTASVLQQESGGSKSAGQPEDTEISAEKAASLELINSIMANPVIPDKDSVLSLNSLPVTEIRARPKLPILHEPMVRLIPVPGLDYEGIEPELIPLLPGFIADVREALQHASQARDRQSTIDVQEAVTRLSGKAQSFGLSKLEGIAACVGRAAAADDIAAVSDLMLELDNTTAKHIEALQNFYDAERNKPASS